MEVISVLAKITLDKNNYMELLISSNAYNCIPFDSTVGKRYFYKVDIPKVKLIDI